MPSVTADERSEVSIAQALEAALGLFSSQGFRATSMREIAAGSGLSVGNLYHHFSNKEEIFQRVIDRYWELVTDPELRLNRIFAEGNFPDDLEDLAAAIEEVVEAFRPYILLIYVDVIEFEGRHIHTFYEGMASRFEATYYAERFKERQAAGEFGDVDPMVAVMVATRWLFYFYMIEKCFGVPMHFGMSPQKATEEFIRLLRFGLLPRSAGEHVNDPAGSARAPAEEEAP